MSKPKPFNNPFGQLKLKKDEPAPSPASPPPPPQRAREKRTEAVSPDDESRLFLESVGAVAPVRQTKTRAPQGPNPPSRTGEDEEVLAQLTELVAGDAPFTLGENGEQLFGHLAGLDAHTVERLRSGAYAVDAELDLHGHKLAEARKTLETFLVSSRHAGRRCVLVIHGRGLHSEGQRPVLKDELPRWLSQGRGGRQALAFASAQAQHGGTGALYVLLRRGTGV